jgi:hypothetical protein
MRHIIKLYKNKYFVLIQDSYGNLYDTMHSFKTKAEAKEFIKLDKTRLKIGE